MVEMQCNVVEGNYGMARKKQLLVVEDNTLNREILKEILQDSYTIAEAENGQAALDILAEKKRDIALILLDIMMPVMDGYTFLEIIKKDAELSMIPVIVMTQGDSEEDEVNALAHGANDFVPKPYRPQVILHRIASIIRFRETAAMVNQFMYDRLTGVYSKEYFYREVRRLLQEFPERKYDIICSNVESFKLFNDIFGLDAGDQLLKDIANIIRKQMGDSGICGRLDSDRFMCLFEKRREYTEEIFAGMRDRIRSASKANAKVMIKWGIYEVVDHAVQIEQMCDRAFLAAEGIQGQYNKTFALYDAKLRDRLLREQAITEAMQTALDEHQFEVYLQPKYAAGDETMAGAEALVRWNHPQWGRMSPGEFIPLFEKNGFITQMDMYMWEQVCRMLADWKKKGYPMIPISVNVSRADAFQINLPEYLPNLVGKYGLDPSLIHLEITESAYTEKPEQMIAITGQLREQGFVIEMDDFGSGFSSLNMLKDMKLDVLKLDMKFVQDEVENAEGEGILDFVVHLARWMHLSVVAEGVETREQLSYLRRIGCDYVQGYLFAKPMSAAEFEESFFRS